MVNSMKRKTSLNLVVTLALAFLVLIASAFIMSFGSQKGENSKNLIVSDGETTSPDESPIVKDPLVDNDDDKHFGGGMFEIPDKENSKDPCDTELNPSDKNDNENVETPDENDETDVVLPDDDGESDATTPDDDGENNVEPPVEDDKSDDDTTDKDDDADDNNPDKDDNDTELPPSNDDEDEQPDNSDDDSDEINAPSDNLTVSVNYTNSQADGYGTMLWRLKVSYNGLNATDLLEKEGKYLIYKVYYGENSDLTEAWYSFAYAVQLDYLEEGADYNATGYLNGYAQAIQFAVVDIAPDDDFLGKYDSTLLKNKNFIALSEIYTNEYAK